MGLQQIKIEDPVKASDVNRAFQKLALALEESPSFVDVVTLQTTPNHSSYSVKTTDRWIAVDARAGLFTISLPRPSAKQVVTIVVNSPTVVQRSDGQKLSGLQQVVIAGPLFGGNRSETFVSTGADWMRA